MKVRILLIAAMLLMLTGCFQYTIDIEFNPEGNSIVRYGLTIDKSIFEMGDSTAIMNSLNSDSVKVEEKDGVIRILKENTVAPEQLEQSGIKYEKKGSSYSLSFSPDNNDFLDAPDSSFDMSLLPPVNITVTVKEGRITESNADSVKERTAYFSIGLNELGDTDKWPAMKVSTASPMMNYIIFFAALALILAAILVIYLVKR